MLSFHTSALSTQQVYNYLTYAVAPRPICFASTIDKNGNINLSPFSFFNVFSGNPPICIFSPLRSVRNNTPKHTYENILDVRECVINIVNYDMVQQANLTSTEYPRSINEFEKAGLTMLASETIRPPRVAESPVQLECVVSNVIELGGTGGAGNLVLAEVKMIHIDENILDEDGKIDQEKIDLVARLGGDWYCRVTKDNLFRVPRPLKTLGIGVDALPQSARRSRILTGNDLGLLGNVERLPTEEELASVKQSEVVKNIIAQGKTVPEALHLLAHHLLQDEKIDDALGIVLLADEMG